MPVGLRMEQSWKLRASLREGLQLVVRWVSRNDRRHVASNSRLGAGREVFPQQRDTERAASHRPCPHWLALLHVWRDTRSGAGSLRPSHSEPYTDAPRELQGKHLGVFTQ